MVEAISITGRYEDYIFIGSIKSGDSLDKVVDVCLSACNSTGNDRQSVDSNSQVHFLLTGLTTLLFRGLFERGSSEDSRFK